MRNEIEVSKHIVRGQFGKDGGRIQIGDTAGVLRQSDAGEIKRCRDGARTGRPEIGEELLDRLHVVSGTTSQLGCHHKCGLIL